MSEILDDDPASHDAPLTPIPAGEPAHPLTPPGLPPVPSDPSPIPSGLPFASCGPIQRMSAERLWQQRRPGERSPARDELARRYLPLARKLATRYTNPNEPLDDLFQVASLGLMRAIDRYRPERGVPFHAFAVPTVLGELKRHFRDTGWSVHVPRDAKELALRVDRATGQLTERLGRSPQVDELAQFLELSVEEVVGALEAANAHFNASLDAPAVGADADAAPLVEVLGSEDDQYALAESALDLAEGIRRLPWLERRALGLRLGEDLKQTEIAERLGCSQMQVSRLLGRATRRLAEVAEPDGDGSPGRPGR